MSGQASPGWYPDGHGNERFWNGSAWTEHLRRPEELHGTENEPKKSGAFSKAGAAIKRAAAEKQAAKDDLERQQEAAAIAAGPMLTSGVFGTSTIEIYHGGYVRVAAGKAEAPQPARITRKTPYEKLRSIKYEGPGRESASAGPDTSALLKASSLMKGGAGLLKASVPGLVVTGISQVAATEASKSILTIATDKSIHSLTNQTHNGFMKVTNKGHREVGLVLEAAAASLLDPNPGQTRGAQDDARTTDTHQAPVVQSASRPTMSDRLRELAVLHQEGILSDAEFAAAKAKLLKKL